MSVLNALNDRVASAPPGLPPARLNEDGEPEPDLVIETAEDLFAALRDPDFLTRLAVLREVHADPVAALAFGRYQGWDVLDELIHQGYQGCGVTYYKALLAAISGFNRDPRAIEFLKKAFAMSQRADVVQLAGRLLGASAGSKEALPVMSALLVGNESEMHARAAADALEDLPDPSPRERIRLAILTSGRPVVRSPLGVHDLIYTHEWFDELSGVFAAEARIALEGLAAPAARMVLSGWHRLSDESRQWALLWGARAVPEQAGERIAKILAGDAASVPVQLAAMDALGAPDLRDAGAAALVPHLTRYLAPDTDPALRLAALRAGATGADWRALLADPNESGAVRQVAIARLAREGAGAVPDLLRVLENADWNLSAPAADALAAIGQSEGEETRAAIVDGARRLVFHESDGVRAASAQTLIALGDELWLEETFLA